MSHWYDKSGQPKYKIMKADSSGLRDTTLRDAKKLGLLYSVTTITGVVLKEGLEQYKYNQLLSTVHSNQKELSKDDWRKKIYSIHSDNMSAPNKRGDSIHNALEKIYTHGVVDESDKEQLFVSPVVDWVEKWFPGVEWIPEQSFAHRSGYGGKVDLHSKCGKYVVDFKSKMTDDLDNIMLYDDYPMQLSAYRNGLQLPKAKCYNVFISNVENIAPRLVNYTEIELERASKMFHHLLEFVKLKNNYDSSF